MTKRLTISIDEETAERLRELAGSQRKQGEFISRMVNTIYENRETGGSSLATEDLRLKMLGLTTELGDMRTRLAALEQVRLQ